MSTGCTETYDAKVTFTLQLQQSIQRLEAERDHYKKEYINYREEQRRISERDNVRMKFERNHKIQKIIVLYLFLFQ